jgi:hypothetical protein
MNKEIVYINLAGLEYPRDPSHQLIVAPTKCKVTINNSFIIENVYVAAIEGSSIYLYNNYEVKILYQWPKLVGRGLVLEFKSDNFRIESTT